MEKLSLYKRLYFPDAEVAKRVSTLFVIDLLIHERVHGIVHQEVTGVIQQLEGRGVAHGLRPATPFTGDRLRGVWHQHYFSAAFMAQNLLNAWGRGRGEQMLVEELLGQPVRPDELDDLANRAATRMVEETLQQRAADGLLTGEWIVFLPRPDGRYYFTLEQHPRGDREEHDQRIYDRLLGCVIDFPDLPAWLEEVRQSSL